jgi:hypothetical protein
VYLYLVDQAEGLTDEQRIELGQLAKLPDREAFWTLFNEAPPGPRTAIMRYWQKAFLPGDAIYLLGLIHDHKVRKHCFWHALAELRRLQLISEGRLPYPWERDCHFMLHVANFWDSE